MHYTYLYVCLYIDIDIQAHICNLTCFPTARQIYVYVTCFTTLLQVLNKQAQQLASRRTLVEQTAAEKKVLLQRILVMQVN
jgi:hypothetical protein